MNKILYVDDEEINLDLFKYTFKKSFEVLTAISANEGLKLLSANDIPVIITDYKMPGMDGIQFIEEIKKITPERICIILTGFIESIVKGKENLIFDVLVKPWENEKILKVINAAFEKYYKI